MIVLISHCCLVLGKQAINSRRVRPLSGLFLTDAVLGLLSFLLAAPGAAQASDPFDLGAFSSTSSGGEEMGAQNITSTGSTWTARSAAEANSWRSVTYGNGTFVAVAGSGTNRVMNSGSPIISNTTPPTISPSSGAPLVDQTLSADPGSWNGSPDTYTYQWQSCSATAGGTCTPVGINSDQYTPQSSDLGRFIEVRVTASNGENAQQATSARTAAVVSDTTPPSVESFTTAVSSPTNSTSINYTLNFSESVTDVTAADITNAGTATGCTDAVSGSGAGPYTVTFENCSASGTLLPRFAAGGATDAASNTGPSAAADGAQITLDRTAPNTIIDTQPSNPSNSAAAQFTSLPDRALLQELLGQKDAAFWTGRNKACAPSLYAKIKR